MSIAYVPNTPKNRRLIARQFPTQAPPSADFKVTSQRLTTYLGEEVRAYFWKGYTDVFHVQTCYFDVLQCLVLEAGFEGVFYDEVSTRAFKFLKPQPQPEKPVKNTGGGLSGLLRRIFSRRPAEARLEERGEYQEAGYLCLSCGNAGENLFEEGQCLKCGE